MLAYTWMDNLVVISTFALSLIILTIPILFWENKAMYKLLLPFTLSFLFTLLLFFLPKTPQASAVFLFMNTLPFLFFGLFLIINPDIKISITVLAFITVLSIWLLTSPNYYSLLAAATNYLLIITSVIIVIAFIKYSRTRDFSLFMQVALFMILFIQLSLFVQSQIMITVSVFVVYSLLVLYFRKETYDYLTIRIAEAEQINAQWERSVQQEVNKRIYEIKTEKFQLEESSRIDPLTGALNKAAITNLIHELIRDINNFTIILFDIDNFKNINDNEGHLAGDRILQQVSKLVQHSIRPHDSLGRYGGDEFLIILPNTQLKDALFVAERIHDRLFNSEVKCTVSIGIAVYPADGLTIEELISLADKGLYKSKANGRNTTSYTGRVTL